jgi:hypothetical protein
MKRSKIINVQFSDGPQQLMSSLKVKCNATGEIKSFYTPYLIGLIKRKYDNNYQYFLKTYISKSARKRVLEVTDEEPALDVYKSVLTLEYDHLKRQPGTIKNRHRINVIKSIFSRRFPEENINSIMG